MIQNRMAFWTQLKLNKPQPYRSLQYLEWIRTWSCIVCGSWPVEAAHSGPHGLGTKASDFRTIPLCPEHHRDSQGLDRLGPEKFEAKYNVDIKHLILQLIEIYLWRGYGL